jgi:hypothetical protein
MCIDAAYYEEVAGRLYGLLISLDDRIGSEQARLLHHFIEVGEYGLALEEIAGTLAQDRIAITGQERGDMLTLATRMKLQGDLVPRAAAVTSQPVRSSRTALRKASHATASASATSVVTTINATVTRT